MAFNPKTDNAIMGHGGSGAGSSGCYAGAIPGPGDFLRTKRELEETLLKKERTPDYSVTFRFVDDHVIATLTTKERPYEFIELVGENLEEIMKKITARMVANRVTSSGHGLGEKK
jgi:hypothetical protein